MRSCSAWSMWSENVFGNARDAFDEPILIFNLFVFILIITSRTLYLCMKFLFAAKVYIVHKLRACCVRSCSVHNVTWSNHLMDSSGSTRLLQFEARALQSHISSLNLHWIQFCWRFIYALSSDCAEWTAIFGRSQRKIQFMEAMFCLSERGSCCTPNSTGIHKNTCTYYVRSSGWLNKWNVFCWQGKYKNIVICCNEREENVSLYL